jgi:hypothetical protein
MVNQEKQISLARGVSGSTVTKGKSIYQTHLTSGVSGNSFTSGKL